MRTARFAEAIKHFQAAIDIDPNSADAWYARADALQAVGRLPEAIESLNRTLALDSQSYQATATFAIGNCHVDLNDLPAAIECYDQALAADPSLDRVWHNRGMALVNLGRFEEAAGSYARAAELDPLAISTHLWQGYCLERLGQQDEAENCFARAARSNATYDIANAWMQIGAYLERGNEAEQALAAYDRALQLRPTWGVAWVRRGTCLAQRRFDDEASEAFDRAIALDDATKLTALVSKGELLRRQGRIRAATAIYQRVLDAPPGSADDHCARANAFRALGNYAEALSSIALAKRLDPRNAHYHFLEAVVLERLGNFTDAASAFQRVINLTPGCAGAWFGQARCLLEAGESEQANTCCEKAAGLGLASDWLYFVHGVALCQLGQ